MIASSWRIWATEAAADWTFDFSRLAMPCLAAGATSMAPGDAALLLGSFVYAVLNDPSCHPQIDYRDPMELATP